MDEMQNGNDGKLDDAGYVQDGYGQDGYVQEGYIQAAGDGCHQTGRDRPYTAQIDREIAEQNTATNGLPRSSELIQVQNLIFLIVGRTHTGTEFNIFNGGQEIAEQNIVTNGLPRTLELIQVHNSIF